MELGGGEILLILIVALLIYGGRLPDVARSIGRSFADLKRGLTETRDSVAKELDPGIHVNLDDEPARAVLRAPSPPEMAKEDVSGEPPPSAGAAGKP